MADVRIGLCERSRSDPTYSRSWLGLGRVDELLLLRYLGQESIECEELHTDVLVGRLPLWFEAEMERGGPPGLERTYLLRIDAMCQVRGRWLGLEVKSSADAKAVGQLCVYRWWWSELKLEPRAVTWCVLTDEPSDHIVGPCAALGFRIVALGF